MQIPIPLQILILFLLIVANGVFALSEIAIVSSRKARLQQRAEMGDRKAAVALELANDPGNLLSTVQVGITLIGILTGAFGGAALGAELSEWLATFPALAPYAGALGMGLVVVVITYFSLIIGELVPKRLGLNNPEGIAAMTAIPMRFLSKIASPVVRFLSASTDFFVRLIGVRPSDEPPVTEEEISVLIRQGTEAGVFEESEQGIVERVFDLGDLRASALMTPRIEIEALDLGDSPEEIKRQVLASPHQMIPVRHGGLDNIVGIVQTKELMGRWLRGENPNLQDVMYPPLSVPENLSALRLLDVFRQTRHQLALVIDEYGGTHGIVTYADILEAIAGETPDQNRPIEPEIVQREDGSWLMDGMLSLDEFKEAVQMRDLPPEVERDTHTLGGLVMTVLRRIPSVGDHFEWGNLRFEVMDMDGRRVDKILVGRK